MCNDAPAGNQPDDLYLAIQQQRCPEEAAAYLADDCRKKDRTIKTLNTELAKTRKELAIVNEKIQKMIGRYSCRKNG
jgi:hypothetical protein